MKTLWLDLPSHGNLRDGYTLDAAGLMSASGINLGNLVFRRALMNITPLDDALVSGYNGLEALAAAEQPQQVVISAANWLGVGDSVEKNNGYRLRTFDKMKLPLVVFGLGVQWSGAGQPPLGRNTVLMARLFGERGGSISVRDELTADTLAKLGVKNCVITGCPSNFLNLDAALGKRIVEQRLPRLRATPHEDLRVHINEYSGGHAMSERVLAAHLEMLRSTPSFYVLQSPALLPFALREHPALPADYAAAGGGADVARLLRRASLFFTTVDGWMDFARTCDLSVGMRIHGTMVPLQAGVPSLLIAHDSRTAGLGGTMHIPRTDPEAFLASGHQAGWVADKLAEALAGFDARRRELARRMLDHLKANDVAPTPAFAAFCA